jgi:hypothetical protein
VKEYICQYDSLDNDAEIVLLKMNDVRVVARTDSR